MRTLQSEATDGKFLPVRGVKIKTWKDAPQNILDEIIDQMLAQNERLLLAKAAKA